MKPIAVIILNWNGEKLLREFLPSVCRYTPENIADIIVADNGSTDMSLSFLKQNYPQVQRLELGKNYGFSEGYNRAVDVLEYPYVVLLNSDVEVSENWLTPLYEYCETHKDVAACQPKIRAYRNKPYFEYAGASGGYLDKYGFPFCRGRIFNSLEKDDGQYDDITDIFWATGACLFVRRDIYKKAGGLDKAFFAHMEEIDLCWRILLQDKRIVVIPQSTVYHLGGATLSASNPQKTYLNFRNNLLMLYKNLPRKEARRILFIRRLYDTVALFRFLMTGKTKDAKAIWKAHNDFRNMSEQYICQPQKNLLDSFPEGKRNITSDYFLKGKKTF